jgi:5-methylcytosine-specific restriction endonuclease McrA
MLEYYFHNPFTRIFTKMEGSVTTNSKQNIKKKKLAIPKAVKVAVWNENVGQSKGETKCFVGCGTTITSLNFAAGHIQSEACGGKVVISNLKPICTTCNSSMGTTNMKEFAKKHGMCHKLGWFS